MTAEGKEGGTGGHGAKRQRRTDGRRTSQPVYLALADERKRPFRSPGSSPPSP